jgi:hypothetical protein
MATNRRAKSNSGAMKSKRGKSKNVIEKPQKHSNGRQNQRRSDVEGEVHVKPVTQYTSSDEEHDNQEGSPTSKNAAVKAYRALLQRYEETKEANVELRWQISNHEEEVTLV